MNCGKVSALMHAPVVYSLSPGSGVESVDLVNPGCGKRSVPPQHDDSVPREVDPLNRVVWGNSCPKRTAKRNGQQSVVPKEAASVARKIHTYLSKIDVQSGHGLT